MFYASMNHFSGAAMIFGIIVGLLFQLLSLFNLKQEFEFQPELFYFIILPPIIFDSGYSMKKRNFFLNMGTILLHAVFGTLICAVVFGYGLYFFASIGKFPFVKFLMCQVLSTPSQAITLWNHFNLDL